MAQGDIFLFSQQNQSWIPMEETMYAAEQDLQAALAAYPSLIPGNQINPEIPRRWLLVQRELGIPGDESGGNRFSLDHLFVDQDAIPTFIECKRASDTRARREVVAQMLDYAANGVEYWPPDRLRQAAAETAQRANHSIDELVFELIEADDEDEIERFWESVESNLRKGRIRLVFVADQIHRDLRRLVEFLNEKLNDVEVLAVEIKQYEGQGQRAMVPRVIGLTETARQAKATSETREKLTRETLLAECDEHNAAFFNWMIDEAEKNNMTVYYGYTGFSVRAFSGKRLRTFAYGYPKARFEIYFDQYFDRTAQALAPIREKLEALTFLHAKGGKTFRAELNQASAAELRDAYLYMIQQMQRLGAENL